MRFSARAKALIAVLLAALGLAAWLPMSRERGRLMAELPQLRAELRQMRADAQELARLRAAAKAPAPDLAAALLQSARQRFGEAARVSAQSAGGAQASFQRVRAKEWFAWVGALQAERGIRVETAVIEATGEPGLVRVSATFLGQN